MWSALDAATASRPVAFRQTPCAVDGCDGVEHRGRGHRAAGMSRSLTLMQQLRCHTPHTGPSAVVVCVICPSRRPWQTPCTRIVLSGSTELVARTPSAFPCKNNLFPHYTSDLLSYTIPPSAQTSICNCHLPLLRSHLRLSESSDRGSDPTQCPMSPPGFDSGSCPLPLGYQAISALATKETPSASANDFELWETSSAI
jgi:hypothetical protein